MKSETEALRGRDLQKFLYHQNIETLLSAQLGIPSLRAGKVVIRDHRDWRINEREIEYCWLIHVHRSLVGWCWLFTIKFRETKFRETINPAEVIQGIFRIDESGALVDFYKLNQYPDFHDEIKSINLTDLFSANRGITLDGIGYEYFIFGQNLEAKIALNSPDMGNWKDWEKAVWDLGIALAEKSNTLPLKEIFSR